MTKNIIRLYCTVNLKELSLAQTNYALTKEQNHYLIDVMRCKVGGAVHLLDGKTGEYQCQISSILKKKAFVKILKLNKVSRNPADLWLLFAPVKKARTELIIEKCVELGVKKILPVITDYTNLPKFNNKRFQNIMISSWFYIDNWNTTETDEKNILYIEILLNRFYIKNILTVFIHHNLSHTIWH